MALHSLALAAVMTGTLVSTAGAQDAIKSQIVGAYTLTGVYDETADGNKKNTWGPGVEGSAVFDASGVFSIQIYGANRHAEPNKGPRDNVVGPAVSYYGTYKVDEANKTVSYHIIQSTFPGWIGFDRMVTIDELTPTTLKTSAANNDPKLGGRFIAHSEFVRVRPLE